MCDILREVVIFGDNRLIGIYSNVFSVFTGICVY